MLLSKNIRGSWINYDGSNDGDEVVIEATTLQSMRGDVCAVDSTRVAGLYLEPTSDGDIDLVVLNAITGAKASINVTNDSDQKLPLGVFLVATDKVVVAYSNSTDDTLELATYTLDNLTPTLDASLSLAVSSIPSGDIGIAVLSPTRMLVSYPPDSSNVDAHGITIGDGSLTADGTALSIATSGSKKTKMCRLDATRAFLGYFSSSNYPYGVIITDGTPPTAGTAQKLLNDATNIEFAPNYGQWQCNADASEVLVMLKPTSGAAGVLSIPTAVAGTAITPNSVVAASSDLGIEFYGSIFNVSFVENDGTYDIYAACVSASKYLSSGAPAGQVAIIGVKSTTQVVYSQLSVPFGKGSNLGVVSVASGLLGCLYVNSDNDPCFKLIQK